MIITPNRRLFMVLTFIIIIIIILITKNLTQAMLFITLITNFMILSHYIMVSLTDNEIKTKQGHLDEDLTSKNNDLTKDDEIEMKDLLSDKFTGWYEGNDPQFGLGSGSETTSKDADFELESLDDKWKVSPDNLINHNPVILPDRDDTDQFMDVDDKNIFMAQMRQRDKRAIDGKVLANKNYFSKYFSNELEQKEVERWWGNRDYEKTHQYY